MPSTGDISHSPMVERELLNIPCRRVIALETEIKVFKPLEHALLVRLGLFTVNHSWDDMELAISTLRH